MIKRNIIDAPSSNHADANDINASREVRKRSHEDLFNPVGLSGTWFCLQGSLSPQSRAEQPPLPRSEGKTRHIFLYCMWWLQDFLSKAFLWCFVSVSVSVGTSIWAAPVSQTFSRPNVQMRHICCSHLPGKNKSAPLGFCRRDSNLFIYFCLFPSQS